MQPAQHGNIVATGTLPSYEFVSARHGVETVHRVKVTGPISLKRRLPLYDATLALTVSSTYFCILDNSGGHENDFPYADIVVFEQKLIDAGIDCFFGATITDDLAYPKIIELVNVSMSARKIGGEVMATEDPETAERFIAEKLLQVANAGNGPGLRD